MNPGIRLSVAHAITETSGPDDTQEGGILIEPEVFMRKKAFQGG